MEFMYYPLWLIYRIWFYTLVFICTLFLSPLLIISILRRSWYPVFFRIARFWAKSILIGMGFFWEIEWEESLKSDQSYIFVSNHTSMIDIMLMFAIVKDHPFVFVGKKELAQIPLFGYFYKRTSILVDRSNAISRKKVFSYAQDRIKQGLSICIFPEGGVPPETIELDNFKIGAFKLSIEHQLPLVPFTFLDNKRRFSYTFFSGSPGRMRIKGHSFFYPKGYKIDNPRQMRDNVFDLILKTLKDNTIKI